MTLARCALPLAVLTALGLVACSGSDDDAGDGSSSAGSSGAGGSQAGGSSGKGGASGKAGSAQGGAGQAGGAGKVGAGSGGASGSGGSSGKGGASGQAGASGSGGAGQGGSSGNQGGSGQAGSGQAGSGQAGSGQGGSGQGGSGQGGSGQGGSGQGGSGQAGAGGESGGSGGSGQAGSGGGAGQAKTPFGLFIGMNGFQDDPVEVLEAAGTVREYHNWSWCEGNGDPAYPGYPNNQNAFSLWSGFWDWDKFYGKLSADGREVFPAVQGGVSWLSNGAMPPVPAGADTTDPASYVAHADHLFQYAARYGAVKVDASKLKLAADQKVESGLGYLHYYEDANEQDAWWVKPGGAPVFSPAEYAAMASADRDGHQGKLGATLGVKAADPGAKLVMGGLAGKGDDNAAWLSSITSYLDGMRAWADANRGGEFPADVINVHHYCFGTGGGPAPSPEACGIGSTLTELAAYRDAHLPGKEIWLTEVGYDTWQTSPLHVPVPAGTTAELVQAQWLARSLLVVARAGLDRAVLYTSRDEDCSGNDCATQFKTCGLTTKKGEWKKKPAWYFVNALRSRLGPMRYDGEVAVGDKAWVLRFRDPATGGGALVAWSPTSTAAVTAGFELTLPAGASAATLVTLADGQPDGTASSLSPSGGKVTIELSESPSLVLVDKID